jgi:integrase
LDPGTTKNNEGRVFPFTNDLRNLLKSQLEKREELQKKEGIICPWVFHNAGIHFNSFRKPWVSACKAAGLPGRIPHDFRRTEVRNLVRAGIPERVAMQLTGHKTRAVFERYNIVSQGDLLDAAKRINSFTGIVTGIVAEVEGRGGAQTVEKNGVSEGARTPDHWSHNPALYQLSYTHHRLAKIL